MFHLNSHQATLVHWNPYDEKHGKDTVNGIALKFETSIAADQLAMFHKALPGTLFNVGVPRFPELGPIQWSREIVGAMLTIDADDLLGERHLRLEATVDQFVLEPLPGGAVKIAMRAKVKPEPADVSLIYELKGKDLLLTIEPPKAGASVREFDLLDKSAAA